MAEPWVDYIPPYKQDNAKGYNRYVDKLAQALDTVVKNGTGTKEPDWSWVKEDGNSHFIFVIDDEEQLTQNLYFKAVSGFIDWGDGSEPVEVNDESTSMKSHTYTHYGTYDVTIKGLQKNRQWH